MSSVARRQGRRRSRNGRGRQEDPNVDIDPRSYPVHCLVCASIVLKFDISDIPQDGVREEEPGEIMECFSKTFGAPLESAALWNVEAERLPFCSGCKHHMCLIIQVCRRTRELEELLKDEIREVKAKIDAGEAEALFSEIYRRDGRYQDVRRWVVGNPDTMVSVSTSVSGDVESSKANSRPNQSVQVQTEAPVTRKVQQSVQTEETTSFHHQSLQTEAPVTRKVQQSVQTEETTSFHHQSLQTEAPVTRKVQQSVPNEKTASVQNHQSVQTDVLASFQVQKSVETVAQLEVTTQTDMLESYSSDRMLEDDAQKEGNFGCTKLREETQKVMEQPIANVARGETTLILAPAAVTIVSKPKSQKRRGKKRFMSQVEDSTTVKPPVVRKLTRNRSVNLESEIAASKELPTPQVTTRQSRNNLRKSTHLEPTAKKSKPSQLDDYEMSPIMSQLKSASGSGAKLNEKIVMNDRITRASTRRRKATITVNPSLTDDEFEMLSNKEAKNPAKKKYTRKATKQEVDKDFVPYNAADTAKATSNRRNSGRGGARIPDPVTIDEVTGTATFWDVAFKKGNSDKYLCQLCPDPEPLPFAKLKAHAARYHTNLTLCKECGKRYNTVSALNSHIKFVHEKKERKQAISTCPICKKPDVAKRVLSRHIFTHCSKQEIADTVASGKCVPYGVTKAFQCRICGHPYAARSEVERHERTHDITPPVPSQDVNSKKVGNCQICGKYMRDLYYHMRTIHPPTKRFLCTQCDKRFSTSSLLNKHKKWHNLQFACHLCSERFAMDYALERHVNRHLNKRPFKCELCTSSFTASSYLYKHMKKCH